MKPRKVASSAKKGALSPADASATKVFGTEFYLEAFRLLMEIVGERAYLKRGSAGDWLAGQVEMLYRSLLILTFGGGTNEVQRDLIGLFGLGLLRLRSQGLNLLQQRDEVMRIAEQDLVEFPQRISGCVQQRLTSFDCAEPIRLQKFGDLCLHLFLLRIEPALPALNAANKIANSYPQWSHHSIPPRILGVSALGCCKDLGELGP